jgi:hypothetical protein
VVPAALIRRLQLNRAVQHVTLPLFPFHVQFRAITTRFVAPPPQDSTYFYNVFWKHAPLHFKAKPDVIRQLNLHRKQFHNLPRLSTLYHTDCVFFSNNSFILIHKLNCNTPVTGCAVSHFEVRTVFALSSAMLQMPMYSRCINMKPCSLDAKR